MLRALAFRSKGSSPIAAAKPIKAITNDFKVNLDGIAQNREMAVTPRFFGALT